MRILAITSALIFVLDQVTKYWVLHVASLDRVRQIDLLPPWLSLRMAWNQGVNFGLLSSETDWVRWGLIALGLVICVWVYLWVRRTGGVMTQIAAGFLIGGALGNIIDRLLYGAVADFLNMSLPGWSNPYSFNVADIAIFAGAFGLILLPQGEPVAAPARGRTSRAGTRSEPPIKRKPRTPKGEPPLTRAKTDEPEAAAAKVAAPKLSAARNAAPKIAAPKLVTLKAAPAQTATTEPENPEAAKPRDAGKPLG